MNIEDRCELGVYLKSRGYAWAVDSGRLRVLRGGVSNAAVLVELDDGRALVLKKALAKLRTKVEWFSSVMRIHREAAGMRILGEILPGGRVPKLLFEDEQEHIIAMTAVAEPHENFKEVLLGGCVENDAIGQFAEILGVIHRRGHEQAGRLRVEFAERSFFESLRMEPYYAFTGQEIPEAQKFLRMLIEQTLERRMTLVHGDYSPKNILIHAGKLVLLDHEVIHFGDPAFDVGFALTHLLSKAHHLRIHRRLFQNAAVLFWKTYLAELGENAMAAFEGLAKYEARCVKHGLGCLLARVAGRSRLEYLSASEQKAQERAVIELMKKPPARINELLDEFLSRI